MNEQRRRWSFRLLALLMLAGLMPSALVVVGLPEQVYAQSAKVYHMDRYDSDITVNSDGSLDVQETLVYVFTSGTFHAGLREIALDKVDGISNIKITEQKGNFGTPYKPGTFEPDGETSGTVGTFGTENTGSLLRIRWIFGPTANATRTFTLSYHADGAVRVYADRDEFDWYAVPPEWGAPVYASRAQATFPNASSTQDWKTSQVPFSAEVRRYENKIAWTANGSLSNGFEVGAQVPKGILSPVKPGWQNAVDEQEKADADAAAAQQAYNTGLRPLVELGMLLLGLLVTIGGILWSIRRWYTGGRDKPVKLPTDYLTDPPSDLPPGLVGTLLDESADVRDIIATIVDQGKKGNLTIAETQAGGLFGGKDFQYTQTNGQTQYQYETLVLQALFKKGSPVQLSELKNEFYSSLPPIKTAMYNELVRLKYFPESPETVRARSAGGGVGILVLAGIVGFLWFMFGDTFSQFLIVPALGLGLVGIVRISMASAMPRKTDFGSEESEKWRAFRRYLENIQKYTGVAQAATKFQQYLPYAVAMGVDQQYIRQFTNVPANVAPAMPLWYMPIGWNPYMYGGAGNTGQSLGGPAGQAPMGGGGGFDVGGAMQGMSNSVGSAIQGLSDSFTSMVNSASSVLTSAPSSSGSGGGGGGWGGGGGGFGGGGGGGGGGGAS
jgi:hypothetical protein